MPIATAVRWTPVGVSSADPPYPIFIAQDALAAVRAHGPVGPEAAVSFGFLIGALFVTPDARTPYLVVESAIHSGWTMAGDLKAALIEGCALAQEEVRSGRRLVGWYQSHVDADSRLSVADVEAHAACFDQPWHVALVIAGNECLTGGVFRLGTTLAHSNQYLPFYELSDGASLPSDGRRVTDVAWANYRTDGAVVPSHPAPPAWLPARPRLVYMEEEPAKRLLPPRLVRGARVGAMAILAVWAALSAYRALASAGDLEAGAAPAQAALTPWDLDRLNDTVHLAVAAFDVRARLFASRKMTCDDLARGLVGLEERWAAYGVARRRAAPSLDSTRIVGEGRMHAEVNAVERRFAQTGCPRP